MYEPNTDYKSLLSFLDPQPCLNQLAFAFNTNLSLPLPPSNHDEHFPILHLRRAGKRMKAPFCEAIKYN